MSDLVKRFREHEKRLRAVGVVSCEDYKEAADALEALQAERDRLREACNQARLAFAGFVSVESAINKLDALGDDT